MKLINEGAARIEVGEAFYNPKMRKLRDISVMFLKALKLKNAKLLDATAATGIRAIRYAKEAGVGDVTMLDINEDAYRSARKNAKTNSLEARVLNESLQEFSGTCDDAFEVIDVDPFGTPVPLMHDVLRISKNGTVLMITATDTATLCGAEGNACMKNYASKPIHNELCHEAGIRILLNYVVREAAQFNFGIEPMLSISDMHYMRIFLKLKVGANEAVLSIKNSGFGAYCSKCHSFSYKKGITTSIDTRCSYCSSGMFVFGPLWLGNLHDKKIIEKMLKVEKNSGTDSSKLIEKIRNEIDIPFFYSIPKVTSYIKSSSIPLDEVIESLRERHRASRTHFEENAIKTDASIEEVIMAVRNLSKSWKPCP